MDDEEATALELERENVERDAALVRPEEQDEIGFTLFGCRRIKRVATVFHYEASSVRTDVMAESRASEADCQITGLILSDTTMRVNQAPAPKATQRRLPATYDLFMAESAEEAENFSRRLTVKV